MTMTIIRRRTTGNILSIYAGDRHLGLVYCPLPGGRTDYEAIDDTATLPIQRFDTEAAAVAYLASGEG